MRKRWSCRRCGSRGTTRLESKQVWHRCVTKKRGGTIDLPPIPWPNREEARHSAWADFGTGDTGRRNE